VTPLVDSGPESPSDPRVPSYGSRKRKSGFGDDFRRFFVRGLATLLPTLITLWLLVWVWNFLWNSVGIYIIWLIERAWWTLGRKHIFFDEVPAGEIARRFRDSGFEQPLGVFLAVLLVYVVGVFVGNLIGRTMWRVLERAVMRLPLVKAIYPAVKQVTDFLLADREARTGQFSGSRVVAVQARSQGIWSIGLVTGSGYPPLNDAVQGDMVTVFIPSSPTSFSGYVVVAHREAVVDLPLTVEEALRMLVSGGVIVPDPALLDSRGEPVSVGPEPRQVAAAALPPGWTIREPGAAPEAASGPGLRAGTANPAGLTVGGEERPARG
jgi:uncharacterized membrane protein